MSDQSVAEIFKLVKKFYCSANPHRDKPENLIKKEKLLTTKADDIIDLEHDIFYEDAVFYTNVNNKEDSMLMCGEDYELEGEDSIATDQSGYRCYKRVKILKTYPEIYADYEVYGDFIDANIFNLQVRRTKESMQEIADLDGRAIKAEGKLTEHDNRIAAAENSIRTNQTKISQNTSKIEKNDSDIRNINLDILWLRDRETFLKKELFLSKDGQEVRALDEIRESIARADEQIGTIRKENREKKGLIEKIQDDLTLLPSLQSIMPVGFCYIQLKNTPEPDTLWDSLQWEKGAENSEFTVWKRIE